MELISCRPSTYPFVFLRLTLVTNGENVAILPLSIIHLVPNSNGLLQTRFHFVLTSWSMIIKPTPSCCWKYSSLQLGQTNTSMPTIFYALFSAVLLLYWIEIDRVLKQMRHSPSLFILLNVFWILFVSLTCLVIGKYILLDLWFSIVNYECHEFWLFLLKFGHLYVYCIS